MVKSILGKDRNINYPEIKALDPGDNNFDATQYEVNILGKDIIIALGQSKYTFIENDIIYFPIYFIKDNVVSCQIGVYEIVANELTNILDEEGDVILEQIDNPLLYSYVTNELFSSDFDKIDNRSDDKDDDNIYDKNYDSGDESDHESDDETSVHEIDNENENILPEQNDKQIDKEQLEYKKVVGQPWVRDFFQSNEYNLIDNEGGGDCLFATIRDALKTVNNDISVLELRSKLAQEVNIEIYEEYKNHYDMFSKTVIEGNNQLKQLKNLNTELRDKLKTSTDRTEEIKIIEKGKIVAEKHKTLKNEVNVSKEMLNEFEFMKKVNSVEELKKIIKTKQYWGDTWAISTLERLLNIKLVLFSSQEWKEGTRHNVLNCGQLNDSILQEENNFEPKYYILLDYTGDHYKLITYKHHKIFTFSQLPYIIKLDVSKNCLQGTSGPYNIIPQFKAFNDSIGVQEPIKLDINEIESDPNALYSNDVVFMIHNKSNKIPLPGKGIGEKIPLEKIKLFSKLKTIDNWRRKLDNDYDSTFQLDGHKWKTVQHYYQANKFKNTNKEFYLLFSLDSNSKIANDVELAKAATSKTGKYKGEVIRNKDIKISSNFYGENEDIILQDAIYAKFNQNNDLLEALIETKNAKILHYKKAGMEPDIANPLMIVRKKFKNNK